MSGAEFQVDSSVSFSKALCVVHLEVCAISAVPGLLVKSGVVYSGCLPDKITCKYRCNN